MRETKANHLQKWDWLEKEYQQKCHAAHTAQQSLEKVQDELRVNKELVTLKDQWIEELENEFGAKNLTAAGVNCES